MKNHKQIIDDCVINLIRLNIRILFLKLQYNKSEHRVGAKHFIKLIVIVRNITSKYKIHIKSNNTGYSIRSNLSLMIF